MRLRTMASVLVMPPVSGNLVTNFKPHRGSGGSPLVRLWRIIPIPGTAAAQADGSLAGRCLERSGYPAERRPTLATGASPTARIVGCTFRGNSSRSWHGYTLPTGPASERWNSSSGCWVRIDAAADDGFGPGHAPSIGEPGYEFQASPGLRRVPAGAPLADYPHPRNGRSTGGRLLGGTMPRALGISCREAANPCHGRKSHSPDRGLYFSRELEPRYGCGRWLRSWSCPHIGEPGYEFQASPGLRRVPAGAPLADYPHPRNGRSTGGRLLGGTMPRALGISCREAANPCHGRKSHSPDRGLYFSRELEPILAWLHPPDGTGVGAVELVIGMLGSNRCGCGRWLRSWSCPQYRGTWLRISSLTGAQEGPRWCAFGGLSPSPERPQHRRTAPWRDDASSARDILQRGGQPLPRAQVPQPGSWVVLFAGTRADLGMVTPSRRDRRRSGGTRHRDVGFELKT